MDEATTTSLNQMEPTSSLSTVKPDTLSEMALAMPMIWTSKMKTSLDVKLVFKYDDYDDSVDSRE